GGGQEVSWSLTSVPFTNHAAPTGLSTQEASRGSTRTRRDEDQLPRPDRGKRSRWAGSGRGSGLAILVESPGRPFCASGSGRPVLVRTGGKHGKAVAACLRPPRRDDPRTECSPMSCRPPCVT